MSLYDNAIGEVGDLNTDFNKAVKVWDWVRSQMDFVKFRTRVAYSRKVSNQDTEVKVVLMEYKSTWRDGDQTTYFYIPGTGIKTTCLQHDKKVLDYLHYQIADRYPKVAVYTRRKIVDGAPHAYIRQLVVKLNVKLQELPPSPVLAAGSPPGDIPVVEPLDEDAYSE